MTTAAVARRVARVTTKQCLGPDTQVDDKASIITPTDPALTDPFLVLTEDWLSRPGFDWHPHRGIDAVTMVLDGVLEYGDNAGHSGALQAGDIQWMTAGRGLLHRQLAYQNDHAHTLQLWLNLPASAKMADTRCQDLPASSRPLVSLPGAKVDVIAGTVAGVTAPTLTHQPVQGAVVTLDPGTTLDYELPATHRAFAYVLAGGLRVAGEPVLVDQIAWSDPAGSEPLPSFLPLATDGDAGARVLLYSGEPLREPVALGGPFAMNHRAEIVQAFADFTAGKFGQVPHHARLSP